MRQKILQALPATASELAEKLVLPRRTVVYHLEKARSLGLVSVAQDPSQNLGRPGYVYTRTSSHIDDSRVHYMDSKPLNPSRPRIRRDPFTEAFFGPK
jgi:predicted ArsR family transcriptional regulator